MACTGASIRLVSLLAASSDPFYEALVGGLGIGGVQVETATALSWEARRSLLSSAEPSLFAMCSGLYVRAASHGLRALATSVPSATRYAGQPIFFADVIVRRENPAREWTMLRGASFAFNDDESLSGYDAVLHQLRAIGETRGFFSSALASGSHARSIDLVRSGAVDVASIDSLILDAAIRETPSLAAELRVVATLGPFSNHVFAVSASVPGFEQQAIVEGLTRMHETRAGRHVLTLGALDRCMKTTDASYESTRQLVTDVAGSSLIIESSTARTSLHAESSL